MYMASVFLEKTNEHTKYLFHVIVSMICINCIVADWSQLSVESNPRLH